MNSLQTLFTFIPGGAILSPGGVDIRHGQRPDKVTGQTVATMSRYRLP